MKRNTQCNPVASQSQATLDRHSPSVSQRLLDRHLAASPFRHGLAAPGEPKQTGGVLSRVQSCERAASEFSEIQGKVRAVCELPCLKGVKGQKDLIR